MNSVSWYGVLACLVILGCGSRDDGAPAPATQVRTVAVSNYPLHYMVGRIGFPLVDVRFPASGSDDPAYWRPDAEDVAALQSADLIILNGASYEQWLNGVSLPPSRVVETARGFEDRWIGLAGAVTHSHGPEGEHEHGEIAFTTWLDLSLAVEQARAVRDALVSRWPEHATLFDDNRTKLEQDLGALDRELLAIGTRVSGTPVIFSHPVYQYFERRYGIRGESAHWEPDSVPTEAMWSEIASIVARTRADLMIWEGEPLPEVRARLRALGVRSTVVDPCGNIPSAGDFLTVMAGNVAALDSAFAQ